MKLWTYVLAAVLLVVSNRTIGAEGNPGHTERCGSLHEDDRREQECQLEIDLPKETAEPRKKTPNREDYKRQIKRLLLSQRISSTASVDLPDDI